MNLAAYASETNQWLISFGIGKQVEHSFDHRISYVICVNEFISIVNILVSIYHHGKYTYHS